MSLILIRLVGSWLFWLRMSNILSLPKMKLLIKSFFESQFAYCPLVWMLYNLNKRFNKLHERALRILYNDDISTFEQLLTKDESVTMHHRNMQKLAIEMYKVKYNILPCPIAEFISKRDITTQSTSGRLRILVPRYGTSYLSPKIWDLIPKSQDMGPHT